MILEHQTLNGNLLIIKVEDVIMEYNSSKLYLDEYTKHLQEFNEEIYNERLRKL